MTRANTRPAVAAFLMLTELLGGCGAQPMKDKGTGTGAQSQSPQPAPPFAGEAEMITGTATPHKQKDAPVETERIRSAASNWRKPGPRTPGRCCKTSRRFSRGGRGTGTRGLGPFRVGPVPFRDRDSRDAKREESRQSPRVPQVAPVPVICACNKKGAV